MTLADRFEKTDPTNPFRSENNTRYTKGLFLETSRNSGSALYTLRDHDYKGYPSLYLKYIQMEDDTEYLFATEYLEGWEHWEMLCQCTWFEPYITRWRKEQYLKKTAKLLKVIENEASANDSKNRFQAAKYLLDREWEANVPSSKKNKRGRPSKEEVQGKLLEEVSDLKRQQEDLERINAIRRQASPGSTDQETPEGSSQ